MIQVISASAEQLSNYKADIVQLIKEAIFFNFPENEIYEDYYSNTYDSLLTHLKNGKAAVFVAFDGELFLGWLWCHPIYRFDSKRLHIANFAVKSESRGNGIGHKLIDAAETYAFQNNYDGIDLFVTKKNESAVGFYKKHGFEVERYLMRKVDKKDDHKNSENSR